MKRLFLLLVCCLFCSGPFAQAPHFKVTENTIVKDADGTLYAYGVWRALLMQGDYEIRPIDKQNEKTEFLLVKLTEEEKNQRFEKMPKPLESDYFRTGKAFSFFKATDLNKNKINLSQDNGRIIVLNFWFINCPPCRMEIPALNKLVETFKGNDSIRFIAIALDENYALQKFLKTMPFNYDIVGNGQYLAKKYGIGSYPTHVIINQEGKVYFHTTGLGMNTVYWLKKSINELLRQSSVAHQ